MIKIKTFTFVLVYSLITINAVPSDTGQDFAFLEKKLNKKVIEIIEHGDDKERLKRNQEFFDLFYNTLLSKGSYDFAFDSLETVSILNSPGNDFRIITWYVPLTNGHFKYFGFIQVKDSATGKCHVHVLQDKTSTINDAEFKALTHKNWFGAYYYDIIHYKHNDKDIFTLLGWKGYSPLTRQRVIEPFYITPEGTPGFGQQIFNYEDNLHQRIVFKYSARASMALRYEKQLIDEGRRARDRNLIVFDRLEPARTSLEGHYQFYYPETNIFDGFVFENGKWNYYQDVDARNP